MFRATHDSAPILVVAFGEKVFGIHARTGQRLWRHEVGGTGVVRVLVHGERVLALGSALVCIEYATGRLVWRAELDGTLASGTLLAAGDLIFVADSGEVAAFEAAAGRQLWRDGFRGEGVGVVALAVPHAAVQADRSG